MCIFCDFKVWSTFYLCQSIIAFNIVLYLMVYVNTLSPRQNGRHSADNLFKCIFLNENIWILINISLNFVPKGPINNIPALVQIIAWHWPGDKPLSEPLLVSLPKHICVARSQLVNGSEQDNSITDAFILPSIWNFIEVEFFQWNYEYFEFWTSLQWCYKYMFTKIIL